MLNIVQLREGKMNDFKNQPHKLIYHTNGKSLQEINGTVKVPKDGKFLGHFLHIQDMEL